MNKISECFLPHINLKSTSYSLSWTPPLWPDTVAASEAVPRESDTGRPNSSGAQLAWQMTLCRSAIYDMISVPFEYIHLRHTMMTWWRMIGKCPLNSWLFGAWWWVDLTVLVYFEYHTPVPEFTLIVRYEILRKYADWRHPDLAQFFDWDH